MPYYQYGAFVGLAPCEETLAVEKEGKQCTSLSLVLAEGVEPSYAAGSISAVLPLDDTSIKKAPPISRGAYFI